MGDVNSQYNLGLALIRPCPEHSLGEDGVANLQVSAGENSTLGTTWRTPGFACRPVTGPSRT